MGDLWQTEFSEDDFLAACDGLDFWGNIFRFKAVKMNFVVLLFGLKGVKWLKKFLFAAWRIRFGFCWCRIFFARCRMDWLGHLLGLSAAKWNGRFLL